MTRYIRAQASISNDTGLARDLSVNVWHFAATDEGSMAQATAHVVAQLGAFYAAIDDVVYSPNCGPELRIKCFDLTAAVPRVPIHDETLAFVPASVVGLPGEVAVCLTYQGASGSGINRRRNTGRVYLGPVSTNISQDSDGDMFVSTTARSMITAAAEDHLRTPPAGPAGIAISWSVFSRSDALGLAVGEAGPDEEPQYTAEQLALGFKSVVRGWVDDAFDTQRRRGVRARTRTNFGPQ